MCDAEEGMKQREQLKTVDDTSSNTHAEQEATKSQKAIA
jgi:hypothetical protein